MKRILFYIAIIFFVSCKSKQPANTENIPEVKTPYIKLPFNEVDITKKNRAFDLGKRLLETCNTSLFRAFTPEEATEKVIQNATVEKLSRTCQKIVLRNGKFINLELLEINQNTVNEDLIFKFKLCTKKNTSNVN